MRKGVLFIGALLALYSCGKDSETIQPKVKSIKEAVYASGYIQSVGEHIIYAQKSGKLIRKQVLEGESFAEGQLLFILDDGLTASRFQSVRLARDIAGQNAGSSSPVMTELDNRIAELKGVVEFDSTNFSRYKNLLKANATSKIDYDKARLALEKSSREYAQALASRKQAQNKINLELKNSQAQLDQLNEEYGFFQIKAPIKGTVFKVFKQPGEFIRAGEPLATIGSGSDFICKLKIDEQDILKVQTGMVVLLKADALAEKVLHAKVSQIYPMVDARDQSVLVDAILSEALPKSFTGLAVEANILIRESKNSLVIPQQYLISGDSVKVKKDGDVKTIKVKIGIKSLDEVEIISGLSSTSTLVLP